MWQNQNARQLLDMTIEHHVGIDMDHIALPALRLNPKRAHILVSSIIGKHTPANPARVEAASHLLADRIYSTLNQAPTHINTERLLATLEYKLDATENYSAKPMRTPAEKTVLIGFAEASNAVAPEVARMLSVPFIHSTRKSDCDEYVQFSEPHSHKSHHRLTPADQKMISEAETIIFMDDEITTGNTMMNLISALENRDKKARTYVISAFVDTRTPEDKERMSKFIEENQLTIHQVFLSSASVSYSPEYSQVVSTFMESAQPCQDAYDEYGKCTFVYHTYAKYSPLKYGVSEVHSLYTRKFRRFLGELEGTTLVVGWEEYMYAPYRLARTLELENHAVWYSSTTASPIIPHNDPEYPVQRRIAFERPDIQETRFLYNVGWFDNIVLCLDPDIDIEVGENLYPSLREHTNNLIVIHRKQPK